MNSEEKDLVIKNLITRILTIEIARVSPNSETVIVTLDSRIKEDLDLDSLEILEMVMAMEDTCNISIDNSLMDFKKISTVKDLADCLAPRVGTPVKSM